MGGNIIERRSTLSICARLVLEAGESRGLKEAQPTRKDIPGPAVTLETGYELTNDNVLRRK